MQGILIVDKPMEWTSFDVIAKLRGILGTRKLGHSGTLDPMATGVLPVFCGGASKAVDLQLDHTKTYCARLRLGMQTDTGDITGVLFWGHKVCIECKDTKKPDYVAHYSELVDEMSHLDTEYGVLVQHRKGLGLEHMDGQMAIMTRPMLDRFTAPFSTSPIPEVVQTMAEPLNVKGTELVWIPLRLFAFLQNDLLPLGPDENEV